MRAMRLYTASLLLLVWGFTGGGTAAYADADPVVAAAVSTLNVDLVHDMEVAVPSSGCKVVIDCIEAVKLMSGGVIPIPPHDIDVSVDTEQHLQWTLKYSSDRSILTFDFRANPGIYELKDDLKFIITLGAGTKPDKEGEYVVHFVQEAPATYNINPLRNEKVTEMVYNGSVFHTTVKYNDDAGRLSQVIGVGAAPGGQDIVSFYEYDNMGRNDAKSYLEYYISGTGGAKRENPVAEHAAYHGADSYAYYTKVYDDSPLNIVEKTGAPGKAYSTESGIDGHPVLHYMSTNPTFVHRYSVSGEWLDKSNEPYSAGQLLRTGVKQPTKGNEYIMTYEYRDAENKILAKETVTGSGESRFTYYAYDGLGRLRYVIPPYVHNQVAGSAIILFPDGEYGKYWYYYDYDKYGRLRRVSVPGKAAEYFVYDKRGRTVLSYDGTDMIYTVYDKQDREISRNILTRVKGTASETVTLEALQAAYDGNASLDIVASYGFGKTQLSSMHYDDYSGMPLADILAFEAVSGVAEAGTAVSKPFGRVTYETCAVMGAVSGTSYRSLYYDEKGRPIQVVEYDTFTKATSRLSSKYDYLGNVLVSVEEQSFPDNTLTKRTEYTYDGYGRLISEKTSVIPALCAEPAYVTYSYGYKDRMAIRQTGVYNKLVENYGYDLQGRLLGQNSRYFRSQYKYDGNPNVDADPRYDGKMCEELWQFMPSQNTDMNVYGYDYDRFGQLTDAVHYNLRQSSAPTGLHSEAVTYDINGNISEIVRSGNTAGDIRSYVFSYDAYKLSRLTEKGPSGTVLSYDYEYDALGNIVSDGRQQLGVGYNSLNLPAGISSGKSRSMVEYIWLADGTKLGVVEKGNVQKPGVVRVYKGSFTYRSEKSGGIGNLEKVAFNGGWFMRSVTGSGTEAFRPIYAITDIRGSVRALYDLDNGASSLMFANNYYPFGATWEEPDSDIAANDFLFNGKERQEFSYDYGLLDYGSRMYDPVIGRWLSTDPAMQFMNPYVFCGNDPVSYIDPDGEMAWFVPLIIYAGARLLSATVKAIANEENFFRRFGQDIANDAKITWGLFKGSPGQILSRFTWEILQTAVGFATSIGVNMFSVVDDVSYYGGATVIKNRYSFGAFTLGSYINGDNSIKADIRNELFQHEYGHYIQSQDTGFAYLFDFAIPSLFSAIKSEEGEHNHFWTEQDANKRAIAYFNRKMPGAYTFWKFERNPIDDYDENRDYADRNSQYVPNDNATHVIDNTSVSNRNVDRPSSIVQNSYLLK